MTFDENDVTPVHSEREILDRVHQRGNTLRRRKRIARGVSGGLVVALLLGGGIAIGYQGGGPKHATGGFLNNSAPTDSPTPTESHSYTATIEPAPPAPLVTSSEQPSPGASPTGTTTCINSYDPVCGTFYWDPAPGANTPMTVTFQASRTTVTVGETLTVHVTAVDPDAEMGCNKIEWGPTDIGFALMHRPQYGRWVTPDKTRGEFAQTYTHAYDKAGTYRIQFSVESGKSCSDPGLSPYSSGGGGSATITVTEAPSPSPSVSESPPPSPSP